jgi:hypothetical protein
MTKGLMDEIGASSGEVGREDASDSTLSAGQLRMLQVIYDLLREREAWPTFRTITIMGERGGTLCSPGCG